MEKFTLEEIGKLAGVSRATVSRVINNYPHIRPEIRERVEKVIAETGYHPNLIARSLASDRSNIIGLVILSAANAVFTDPYFPRLIQGITQNCNTHGLTLALFLFNTQEEERITLKTILSAGLLDGLIITADHKERSIAPLLTAADMPFVLLGRPLTPATISFVDVDNVAGAFMAVEHLIKLGHQRIGVIATALNTAGDDRLSGYYHALEANGIAIDPRLIAYADFSVEHGYIAMQKLLSTRPDAVFVTSDTMALGALRALREADLRVPDDIALVGFDDLPPALQADPPLTTIRQPIQETGSIAVDTLTDVLKNGAEPPRHIVLPTELVIRQSSGADSS